MSINGTAQTEYASLSGKIHAFVVDKTLSISGACADAKATGEAIVTETSKVAKEAALDAVSEYAGEVAKSAAVNAVADEVEKAIDNMAFLTAEDVRGICV